MYQTKLFKINNWLKLKELKKKKNGKRKTRPRIRSKKNKMPILVFCQRALLSAVKACTATVH